MSTCVFFRDTQASVPPISKNTCRVSPWSSGFFGSRAGGAGRLCGAHGIVHSLRVRCVSGMAVTCRSVAHRAGLIFGPHRVPVVGRYV